MTVTQVVVNSKVGTGLHKIVAGTKVRLPVLVETESVGPEILCPFSAPIHETMHDDAEERQGHSDGAPNLSNK